jgi:hypothetical protein
VESSAENSPLHLDYQRVKEYVACAPKNKATRGIFNGGNIGVMVYALDCTLCTCAALHDFGTILRKVDVAVATFAFVRKTSGGVDCPVSFSSIGDSSSFLPGSSVCVRHESPASCRLPDAVEVSVWRDLCGIFEGFLFFLQRGRGMTFEERGGYIGGVW